jgi:hypothetical protein
MTPKVKRAITEGTVANPSSPSVRFTALVVAKKISIQKGIAK